MDYLTRGFFFIGIMLILGACGVESEEKSAINDSNRGETIGNDLIGENLIGIGGSGVETFSTPESPKNQNPYDLTVLSETQRDRIYLSSLNYLAETEELGIEVARGLEFVKNGGHPSNMCGPLAMAILRDAGLVEKYLDLHPFWVLNPRKGYDDKLLESTFPRDKYLWYRDTSPIHQIVFSDFPLFSGDFVYLYAGGPGTFEHILVVTKVDEEGRAFTVTNRNTENDGYIIEEMLLYDPNNPGEGIFYEWTDRSNVQVGITGFGGFQLWRPIEPIVEINLEAAAFADEIDDIINNRGGYWNVVVKKIGGETIYSRQANERLHPASTIKVATAMLLFEALDLANIDAVSDYLADYGPSRTYQQLLEAMLIRSEEDAAKALEKWINDRINVSDIFAEWGLKETLLKPRRSTAYELVALFEGLYDGSLISEDGRTIILDLLDEYSESDETRLRVIRDLLPEGSQIYNKRGSLIYGRLIVADIGIVENGDDVYILAFFGYPDPDAEKTLYEDLETAIEESAIAFLEYINK